MPSLWVVSAIVAVALAFDGVNGFHDAANSIATIVSTRVLRPQWAVVWAAVFNFIAFLVFGLHVAKTVGKGIVDPRSVTLSIITTALLGAIAWDVITWRYGMPMSSSHALRGNDAQKTMGILLVVLVAGGRLDPSADVPLWVVLACHAAMGLGTLAGGWRIVKTLGQRICDLKPVHGFSAEAAGALCLYGATWLGIPVSTTHTITGSIIGVGSTRGLRAVRWGVAERVV